MKYNCQLLEFLNLNPLVTCLLLSTAIACKLGRSEEAPSGEHRPTEVEVRELLRTSTSKYGDFVAALLSTANKGRLAELKRNPNWGIALQSAWSQFVDDRRFESNFERSRLRDGAHRWLGFAEAKLGFCPPQTWCECIITANRQDSVPKIRHNAKEMGPLAFDSTPSDQVDRVEIVPGLRADASISAIRMENSLRLSRIDGRAVDVDLGEAYNLLCDDGRFRGASVVEWFSTSSADFIVLRRLVPEEFCIAMIPKGTSNPKWYASVGGGYVSILRTGDVDHHVDLSAKDSTLFVCGYSSLYVYIDALDISSGECVARFHSGMW